MKDSLVSSGIILKRISYRENDSLIIVYTKSLGKQILIARGTKSIKSKLIGHLEPLNLTKIMIISGKGYDYLASALCLKAYLGIKKDLNKLYYVGKNFKLFNTLISGGEKDEQIFELLERYLERMDSLAEKEKAKIKLLSVAFLVRLAAYLGYSPEFNNCIVCGERIKSGGNYFDFRNGGVVDSTCSHNNLLGISDNTLKLARILLIEEDLFKLKIKVEEQVVDELFSILEKFLNNIT